MPVAVNWACELVAADGLMLTDRSERWLPQANKTRDSAKTEARKQTGRSPIRSLLGAPRRLERETGVEPATSTLARSRSTTELLPLDGSFYTRWVSLGQYGLRSSTEYPVPSREWLAAQLNRIDQAPVVISRAHFMAFQWHSVTWLSGSFS